MEVWLGNCNKITWVDWILDWFIHWNILKMFSSIRMELILVTYKFPVSLPFWDRVQKFKARHFLSQFIWTDFFYWDSCLPPTSNSVEFLFTGAKLIENIWISHLNTVLWNLLNWILMRDIWFAIYTNQLMILNRERWKRSRNFE